MAAETDAVGLPNIDDPDGRDKNEDPLSRAGRSESAPSMADMDILLPGRWDPGPSRESRDDGGALADCEREPYECGGDGGGIWRFPNAGGADCSSCPVPRENKLALPSISIGSPQGPIKSKVRCCHRMGRLDPCGAMQFEVHGAHPSYSPETWLPLLP